VELAYILEQWKEKQPAAYRACNISAIPKRSWRQGKRLAKIKSIWRTANASI